MTAEIVRHDWKAHVYGADEALSLGMIDAIATLDHTLARVMSTTPTNGSQALDTAQELARATAQDRAVDVSWQNGIEAALLELEF